jgi:hypothetical protein
MRSTRTTQGIFTSSLTAKAAVAIASNEVAVGAREKSRVLPFREQWVMSGPRTHPTDEEFEDRKQTYKWFVHGTALLAGHALFILMILAYVFSDRFG